MPILQAYILLHLLLRSVTDGIDRLYSTEFSQILAAVAICVATGCVPVLVKHPPFHLRLYNTIGYLTAFIIVSFASWLFNSFVTESILDQHAALVVSTRFLYYLALFLLLSCVYTSPGFTKRIHYLYAVLLFITGLVALAQYSMGDVKSASEYEDFERVWGLSSHPVLLSVELILMLLIYELSRRKIGAPLGLLDLLIYLFVILTLVVAVSKTGVVLLAMVVGIYVILKRPVLLPLFIVLSGGFVLLTPFEQHFAELLSIPDYIVSGDFKSWDYRTAVTSYHWRLTHWYTLTTKAFDQPWLGYGPGQVVSHNEFELDAHSQFLQVFFDQGAAGLVTYMLFWFSIPFTVWTAFQRTAFASRSSGRELDIRDIWTIAFISLTFAGTFSFGFSLATLAFSHLIVSVFITMSPDEVAHNNAAAGPKESDQKTIGQLALGRSGKFTLGRQVD